jgi:hypothetical protein
MTLSDRKWVEWKVRKLKKQIGKQDYFSRLQSFDMYRAGLFGGIKYGREQPDELYQAKKLQHKKPIVPIETFEDLTH